MTLMEGCMAGMREMGGSEMIRNVPLTEEELLREISELEGETERLTGGLEGLEEIGEGRNQGERKRVFAEEMQRRDLAKLEKVEREGMEVTREVEVLLGGLEEEVERAARRLPGVVRSVLGEHDVVLERVNLGQVGLETETSISTDVVEQLSTLLAGMLAEEVQLRLDRVFLEGLRGEHHNDNGNHSANGTAAAEDAAALEQDLSSLHAEIPAVAAMFVAQMYGEPLLRAVREEGRHRGEMATRREQGVTGGLDDEAQG